MPETPRTAHSATALRAAISHRQLLARTEVERTSSLPVSMFETCDPMLEASLVDSVERMMNCLHEPRTTVAAPEEAPEMRTEKVSLRELRELPGLIAGAADDIDLETGTRTEYLTLLVDTWASGDAATRLAAGQLLQRDFEIEMNDDLEATAEILQHCLHQLEQSRAPSTEQAVQLAEMSQRIATGVVVQTATPTADLEQ